MTRGRDKRLTWPKTIWRFHGESVHGSFYVLTTTMNFSYKVFKSFVSLPKYNLFLYSCLYFYVLTTILNFSYNVFKSFVICKTVSNLAVVYALSFSRLCLVQ